MPEYLLRFVTVRPTAHFRFAELDALLEASGLDPDETQATGDA